MINLKPLSILISALAMSGILTHTVQAESLVIKHGVSEHRQDLLSVGRHIHIDSDALSGSTHDLRVQDQAARPRDDDDKDRLIKRRTAGEGFGNSFSTLLNL